MLQYSNGAALLLLCLGCMQLIQLELLLILHGQGQIIKVLLLLVHKLPHLTVDFHQIIAELRYRWTCHDGQRQSEQVLRLHIGEYVVKVLRER